MGDPFTGITLKLNRARDQTKKLADEMTAFCNTNPYRPKADFDADTRVLTLSVNIEKSILTG